MWGVWGQRQLVQEDLRFPQPLKVSPLVVQRGGGRAERALESHLPRFLLWLLLNTQGVLSFRFLTKSQQSSGSVGHVK